MNFEEYNFELLNLKINSPSQKLKTGVLHKLEITKDFADFFESKEEQLVLKEFEESTNFCELKNYEKELDDRKF